MILTVIIKAVKYVMGPANRYSLFEEKIFDLFDVREFEKSYELFLD